MLQRLKNQKGFTLVELMVVLLIIGILIAVAVPVFLGARSRAQNNAANQAVINASRSVAAEYAGSTPNALPILGVVGPPVTGMMANEPSYTWQAVASTGPTVVQYVVATGVLSVKSDSSATAFATATVSPTNGSITKTLL
ncbi:hypothetical protein LCGC14_2420310 [marine sediment metagenome]|uniref:Type II secretion system protein GspG C-terminal domain-containing protein n=1 Tax=marine sediment metagenome TaxID=412755 RepID=A0A0F9CC24_9ZZZZ